MRWVIMAVVALVAIIIAIFAAGAVLPQKHVASSTIRISTGPQTIWDTIIDHSKDPQWRPELKSVEKLADHNGHSVWQENYKDGMKLRVEDTSVESPKKLVREVRETGNIFSGRWEIEVTQLGTTYSEVRITEYGEVANPFFRFMSRFVFGHTKSMEQYLTSLRNKLDGSGG